MYIYSKIRLRVKFYHLIFFFHNTNFKDNQISINKFHNISKNYIYIKKKQVQGAYRNMYARMLDKLHTVIDYNMQLSTKYYGFIHF